MIRRRITTDAMSLSQFVEGEALRAAHKACVDIFHIDIVLLELWLEDEDVGVVKELFQCDLAFDPSIVNWNLIDQRIEGYHKFHLRSSIPR